MLLIQKLTDDTLKIIGRAYPNTKALAKDMRNNPHKFNENCEYGLIEPMKLLHVEWEKKARVHSRNILQLEEKK